MNLKIKSFERESFSNPVPFNGQNHQQETGPGTSDQSLLML